MDGIELMAGAMHAAQARLDVSASNLANVSSAGFRRRVAHASLSARGLSVSTSVAAEQGPLERTGRAFDISAVGGGFAVRDPHGRTVYEQSASFALDANRHLVDGRGNFLIDARGGLIRGTADATIDALGVARSDGEVLGHLRLSRGASVESGFLERSNVDAVHEMVDVLSAQRAFETAEKAHSALDETRAKDVNDVARVKG
jgi:flagellar basal body rod protein FlgG